MDPDMTQMLEVADKDFKAVTVNMPKEMMGIMSKQMGNLIREMDKLTVDWTLQEKDNTGELENRSMETSHIKAHRKDLRK